MTQSFSRLLPLLLILGLTITPIKSYDLYSVVVTPSDTTINVYTSYTITIDRTTYSNGSSAPWSTTPVPANSNITIIFPSQFNTTVGYVCPTYPSCSVSNRNLVITGAFPTAAYPDIITVTISNVLNPSPAITTDEFMATVGNDYTVANISNFGQVQLSPASFVSCAVSFNPGYVNRTEPMIVTITPKNTILSSGYIQISFPIAGYWANDLATTNQTFNLNSITCSNQSANVQNSLNCSGSLATKIINISRLFSSSVSSSFSFAIAGLIAPPSGEPIDILTIQSFVSGYAIDQCTSTITGLIPNVLNSFTITPTTTMAVNKVVSLRFNATIVDSVSHIDTITITFPAGSILTNVSVIPSPGSQTYQMTSATTLQMTFLSTFKTQPAGFIFTYTFSNYTAPPSTQITSPFTFTVSLNGYPKQTATATLQAVANTLTFTVIPALTEINKNTTYTFSVTTLDPILSSGRININFPTGLGLSFSSSGCAILTGTNISSSVTCSQPTATSLILSGFNSSSGNIPAQTITISVLGVVNPSSTAPTGSFTVTTYYSANDDTLVATGTGNAITATPSTITSVTVIPSSLVVQATSVSYTVKFTPINNIPVSGLLRLGIPIAIPASLTNLMATSCSAGTSSLSTVACSSASNSSLSLINFTIPSGATAGIPFNLQVQSIFTNPSSTQPVSSFTIETFTSSGYLIDNVLSGVSAVMTTPASFTSINVMPTNSTNSAVSSYKFVLSQPSILISGSTLVVTFPNQILAQTGFICTDLSGASTPCSFVGQILTVSLPATANNSNFGFIITNIINPPSLKPSSKFSFSTQTSTGFYYSQSNNNISVANTQFSSFPILSGTFSNKILGASNNLTLNFNPTAPITGYLLITIADSFTIGSLACLSYTGTCIANGNILNISGNFNTGSNTITITGLTSPLTSPTDFTSVVSYDSSGYIIDSNTNTIIFIPACTLPCKTCVTNMVTCTSCYNNTAISVMVYYLSVNNSCVSSCPNGYFTDAANLLCIACSSPCKTCSGSTNNCTSCVSGSSFPYLNVTSGFVGTCLTQCPAGMFPDTSQLVPICTMCQSPCSTCTSSNVCLTCVSPYYMYSGICANTCPDNITITNTVTRVCDLCAPVCSTCSITTTNCTNCSAIAFLYLGNCVSTCPSPLVINNGTCGGCELPCLTCVQISTNCTSCDTTTSTPHLLNNSCITSCPIKYYNTSNTSVCMSCADLNINCDLCINQTTCSSACNTGYVYLNGTCLGVTPAGYVNISSIAQPCLGDCATCSINQTNCLSCKTLNLSGNFCVSSCPVGTASINMICTACNSPCLTCLGSVTSCLSCDPSYSPAVYLSGTRCVTSCPSGTYTNDTNNECTTCTNQCLTCTSASSCLSCISGYSLFSNTCSQGCQSGYVSVNQICLACLFTCGTCSINQYNCTSCLATLSPKQYLTGNSCVQTCPDTFYGNISTLLCTQCPSPCYTCSSTSICTSCLDGYSLSFNGSSCLVSCPAGYYSSNKLCEPCATGCNTCSNTNTTCTTCSSGYYMVAASSSCVTTCPSGLYPEAVSQTCVGCQSPCSSCTGNQINCTSCISGKNLLGNTCVDSCPTAWYNQNGICEQCPTVCLSCLSVAVCTSCLSGYYTYQTLCYSSCPSPYVVIKNGICSACSATNCAICTSADVCTSCMSPKLLYNSQCVDTCPDGYTSNSTNCVQTAATQQLNTTLSSSKLFPYPMTIGSSIVILICCISKFQNIHTFLSGAIYGLVSIFELLAHGYFIYLLYTIRLNTLADPLMFIAFGSLASLVAVNIICFITLCCIFQRDQAFKNWLRTSGNKVTYVIFCMLSSVFTFKLMNIIFCKLFNFMIFKAKLEHLSKLFCLHFLPGLAIIHSFSALAAAGYTLYTRTSDTQDQLFIASIDLIVTVSIELIMAIFNAHKEESFFADIVDGVTVHKKFDVNDEDSITSSVVASILNQKEKGLAGRYNHRQCDVDSEHIDILTVVDEKFDESSGLVPYKEQICEGQAPRPASPIVVYVQPSKKHQFIDQSQQMYEILSSRSNTPSVQQFNEGSDTSIISKPTTRVAPSFHEASVQMTHAPKNDVSIQLDYIPNAVNFNVIEKSIITQSVRPSMDDEMCLKESRRSQRGREFDQKLKEKEAEFARIKKLIKEKQKGYMSSSFEDSKLAEFHQKEDFNRTEQLEQMGLQRPDQILASHKQKALPVETPSHIIGSDVLVSDMSDVQEISQELKERNQDKIDRFDDIASRDLKEFQYNQSKPPGSFSPSSPLKSESRLPQPHFSKQIKQTDKSLSDSGHYDLDWFNSKEPSDKDYNKFVLTKEEMLEGVSKLSEDGFEDIQQLKSEMQNKIIEEENESDIHERPPVKGSNRGHPKDFTSLTQINQLLASSQESLIDPNHIQTIPVKPGFIEEMPHNLDKLNRRQLAFASSMEQSVRESDDQISKHPMYVKMHKKQLQPFEEYGTANNQSLFKKHPSQGTQLKNLMNTQIKSMDLAQSKELDSIEPPSTSMFTKKSTILKTTQVSPNKLKDSVYLESSEQEDDIWQHPAYVKLEQGDQPLMRQEEDDTEYIYNKTESEGPDFQPQPRGYSAQTKFKIGQAKPRNTHQLEAQQDKDTNQLNISFGKGDWNSISKEGTIQKARPKIQGDYLSQSEVSDYRESTEKRMKNDNKETEPLRKNVIKGQNFIESSAASGDSIEFRMTGLTSSMAGINPTANRQRFIQSAGYRQPYAVHEPIMEEKTSNQRMNTQQFRSTNLESDRRKGEAKLILSQSKEKLRGLPYTSSQERLEGLSRASSNDEVRNRVYSRKSLGRRNEIKEEPNISKQPSKIHETSNSVEKNAVLGKNQVPPSLQPRPSHEGELKLLEKAVKMKPKGQKYKQLERIYLSKDASDAEE